MEKELIGSIIQTNWNIPSITIEKITDTAWDINEQCVLKRYNSEKELQRNIMLMELLLKKQIPVGEIIISKAGLKYVKGKNVLSIKEHPGIVRQILTIH